MSKTSDNTAEIQARTRQLARENRRLDEEIKQLREENRVLMRAISIAEPQDTEIWRLRHDLEVQIRENLKQENEIERLRTHVKALKNAGADIMKKLDLEGEVEMLRGDLAGDEVIIDDLKADVEDRGAIIQGLHSANTTLNKEVHKLEAEIEQLRTEVEQLRKMKNVENERLEHYADTVEKENERLRANEQPFVDTIKQLTADVEFLRRWKEAEEKKRANT